MPRGRLSSAERLQRDRLAVEARLAGMTYEDIAAQLGFSNKGAAWKAIDRTLRARIADPAEQLRRMELERLDVMLAGLWGNARKGHLGSVDRVLAVMRQRARYVPGLEEPEDPTLPGAAAGGLTVVLQMPGPEHPTPVAEDDLAGMPRTPAAPPPDLTAPAP